MYKLFGWIGLGIHLYLENAAKRFQPIRTQVRMPLWLIFSLTIMLGVNYIIGTEFGFRSDKTIIAMFVTVGILTWVSLRIVFKYPPDDYDDDEPEAYV